MIIASGFLALALMADAAASPAARPVVGTPAATPDPNNKIICRGVRVTGSLIAGKRVCQTKREWVLAEEQGRKLAEKLVEDSNK